MSAPLMSEQRQEHDNIATITGNRMVAFVFGMFKRHRGRSTATIRRFFFSYRGIVTVVLRLHLLQTQKKHHSIPRECGFVLMPLTPDIVDILN